MRVLGFVCVIVISFMCFYVDGRVVWSLFFEFFEFFNIKIFVLFYVNKNFYIVIKF